MKPVHKDAIRRLRREHEDWTIAKIAQAAGCHPQTVRYWLSAQDRRSRADYAKIYRQRPGVAGQMVAANIEWRRNNRASARRMDRDSYARRRERLEAAPELAAAQRLAAAERQRSRRDRLQAAGGAQVPAMRAALEAQVLASIRYTGGAGG
jgi:hypothetical protein